MMPANLVKWKMHQSNLAKSFKASLQQVDGMKHTDCVIMCGGRKFPCHRVILSASSEFFDLILRNHPEHIEPVIVIDQVEPVLIESMVNYLYTGVLTINTVKAKNFLQCCSYFKIKGLMTHDVIDTEDEVEEEAATITPLEPVEDKIVSPGDMQELIEVVHQEEVEVEQEEVLPEDSDLLFYLKSEVPQSTPNVRSRIRTTLTSDSEVVEEIFDQSDFTSEAQRSDPLKRSRAKYSSAGTSEKRRRKGEGYTQEQLNDSIEAVCQGAMNLSTASHEFNVPKSVLWRNLQKRPEYVPYPVDKKRDQAKKALASGVPILKVLAKYNIPMATLYRDKQKLIKDGVLGAEEKRSKEDVQDAYQQAIQACKEGMAQNEAAKRFNVAKSTLWRKMKKLGL